MTSPSDSRRARLAVAPRLLSLRQAASELGLREWTLRSAAWRGELPLVRLGKLIRIDRRDLERWLEGRKTTGPQWEE